MHIKGYVNAPLFGIKPVKLVVNDKVIASYQVSYQSYKQQD